MTMKSLDSPFHSIPFHITPVLIPHFMRKVMLVFIGDREATWVSEDWDPEFEAGENALSPKFLVDFPMKTYISR